MKYTQTNKLTYMSKDGQRKLQDKLDAYKQEYSTLRRQISELAELKDADEYDMIEERIRLTFLQKEIEKLECTLQNCRPVEDMLSLSSVQLGSRVLLQDDDQKLEYMVVDPLEADPSEGKISHESPLGRALLGKVVNSWVKVVAPRRSLKYRILGIR